MSVIDVAISQVGTKSKGNNNKYNTDFYGHMVNGDAYPWCAVFVWWCAKEAGEDCVPKTASVSDILRYAKENGCFEPRGYMPKIGDIFIHQTKKESHTGFIVEVDEEKYYTIEGNSDAQVSRKSYHLTNYQLVGFYTPKYKNPPKEVV